MKKLRNRFERFCYKNRDKGIPNLMLYLTVGQALVYLFTFASGNDGLYDFLCFDRSAILEGELWRLFSYPLTNESGNILLVAISLICYYSLGRAMENAWGTCRFNLFYLSGMILMDIFAMTVGGMNIRIGDTIYIMDPFYYDMGSYLNLSLFLGYATLYPNTHFLLFFIIPVKAWIFALFYLGITAYQVISYTVYSQIFPHSLFPLVALANYFLFFGKDVVNVIPMSWRVNAGRLFKKKPAKKQAQAPKTGTIPFPNAGSYQATTAQPKAPYTHRCTVCGRTDVSDPELEFRYCSRCNGYYCYCEDHISNHTHVQ